MDREVPNLAQGYTRMGPGHRLEPGPWRNNIFAIEPRGGPAGGGYSTAGDLLRFAVALRDHALLGARSTELVLSERVKDDRGGGYGYGFQVNVVRGRRIVGHSGGFAGVHSKLDIYPESGYVAVVLSNYDRGAARIVERLQDVLTRVE